VLVCVGTDPVLVVHESHQPEEKDVAHDEASVAMPMHARGHLEEKAILFSTASGGGDLVIG
jgi:hypothetical protein